MDILLADRFKDYTQGISIYSLEAFHSEMFSLGGFDEFFDKNYGIQNHFLEDFRSGKFNGRLKRFTVFEDCVNNPDTFLKTNAPYTVKQLNIMQVFNTFEKKKFKTATDVIFHQWILEAKKHGVDISDEQKRFADLQVKGFECLKQVEKHKRVIDTAIFKTADIGRSFNTVNNEKASIEKMIQYYSDNLEFLSINSLQKLALTGGYGLLDLKDEFNNVTASIVDKIRLKQPHAYSTVAETYSKFLKTGTGELTSFFTTKFDEAIQYDIELSKAQSIKRASIFVDGSVLFINKNDEHIIPENSTVLSNHVNKFNLDLIDFKFRKQPLFGKLFKNKYAEDGSISKALATANSFLNNYDILKQMKFDKSMFEKGFEQINDYIENSVKTYKVNRYANSILSSKNKHLMTEKAYPYFEKFYDEKLKEDFVQDFIGKKLSLLKTPEEFTEFVKQVHNQLFDFGQHSTNIKLEAMDKKAIINTPDECIVYIENFTESRKLGTDNWCIVRNQSYFDDYVDKTRRQYFVFNYTKESSDTMSMIGITLTEDGRVHAAHKKNDDCVRHHNSIDDLKLKIICADYEFYKDNLHGTLKQDVEIEMKLLERKKERTLKNNKI